MSNPTRGSSSRSGVLVGGRVLPIAAGRVRQIVRTVLAGERRSASVSITFLGPDAMRRLNREHRGRDRPTDVLAFTWQEPGGAVVGDVYVCRAVADLEARSRGIPEQEELVRLVVHGVLHVLGYDHPAGAERTRCGMWRRQERYVKALA